MAKSLNRKSLAKPLSTHQQAALRPLVQIEVDIHELAVRHHRVLKKARPLFKSSHQMYHACVLVAGRSVAYWQIRHEKSEDELRSHNYGIVSLVKNTSIGMEATLYLRLRKYCDKHGLRVKPFVSELVEGYLDMERAEKVA